MRRIRRRPLSSKTLTALANYTARIEARACCDRKAFADRLWTRDTSAKREVRSTLVRMASGRTRCMYCEDSSGTDIDHFCPRTEVPERTFDWENLTLACGLCNNAKNARFPRNESGAPLLLDPTADEPLEHLRLLLDSGDLEPETQRGRATVDLFKLNDDFPPRRLPTGRKDSISGIIALLSRYEACLQLGDQAGANAARRVVVNTPFAGVVEQLVRTAESPDAELLFRHEDLRLVRAHDLLGWLLDEDADISRKG